MKSLPHALEREVLLCARPETASRYLTDQERFARWLGAGSRLEPRVGGALEIVFPGGVAVVGEVFEWLAGARAGFTYGYAAGAPVSPGGSRVTIAVADDPAGARVRLRHEFAEPGARDQHLAGWRYQLAVLANLVCAEQHAGLGPIVDRYLAAWGETAGDLRRAHLQASVSADVEFRDAHGCVHGLDELDQHIAAVQVHMPGTSLRRRGEPRQCQGSALIDWLGQGAEGTAPAVGSLAVQLAPDGRLARVTGFPAPPPAG